MDKFIQLEQVGVGASSRVYGARRKMDNEIVVIKRYTGAATVKKFRDAALTEASTLMRLKHPNIMPVLDCFGDGGDVCVVFPFATGGSVYNVLRGDPAPSVTSTTNSSEPMQAWTNTSNSISSTSPNPGTTNDSGDNSNRPLQPLTSLQVAHIANHISSALAYIHNEGIMHRDIKPENLMLLLDTTTNSNNKSSSSSIDVLDYNVMLSDFGVVAVLDDSEIAHTFVGTRAYMAPEVLGEEPYGKPADIFSFGATLFTCATGVRIGATPAVRASLLRGTWTLENTVAGLSATEKTAWNNLSEPLKDLITNCLKMKPEDRLTAQQASDHPVHAVVRAEALERQKKLQEAAKAKALLQESIMSSLGPVQNELTTLKTSYTNMEKQLKQVTNEKEASDKQHKVDIDNFKSQLTTLSDKFTKSETENNKLRTEVTELRTNYTKLQGEIDKLKELVKSGGGLKTGSTSPIAPTIRTVRNRTSRIVYTDSGMLFANAMLRTGDIAVGGQDKNILILDPSTFTVRATLRGHTNYVYDILELPDGNIASCSYDQNCMIFDTSNWTVKHTLRGHTGYVYSLVLLPDGRIASGSSDKNIRIWNPSTGKCDTVLGAGHTGHVYILAIVEDNGVKRIVSGNGGEKNDMGITFWNITNNSTEKKLLGHEGGVCSLVTLPNNRLASGCLTDPVIRIWDINTSKCLASLPGHPSGVACMVVTPDGKRLITGGYDFAVRVWNLTKYSLEKEFMGHTAIVRSVCLTHDGDILSCSDDKTMRLWNME